MGKIFIPVTEISVAKPRPARFFIDPIDLCAIVYESRLGHLNTTFTLRKWEYDREGSYATQLKLVYENFVLLDFRTSIFPRQNASNCLLVLHVLISESL